MDQHTKLENRQGVVGKKAARFYGLSLLARQHGPCPPPPYQPAITSTRAPCPGMPAASSPAALSARVRWDRERT
jgi:hypothetical protein